MIEIKSESAELHLNEFGAITYFSTLKNITPQSPCYLVLFQDYSRLVPFCRLLDSSSMIDDVITCNSGVTYEKQVEDFEIKNTIKIYPNGLDWHAEIINSSIPRHYRFGMSLPCTRLKDKLTTNIANYFMFFEECYRDQSSIELPYLTFDHSNSNSMSIFSSWKYNTQFFLYNDNGMSYVRATTSTTFSNSMCLSIRLNSCDKDIFDIYLEKYPGYDRILTSKRDNFFDLSSNYKVKIVFQSESGAFDIFGSNIEAKKPTDSQLKRWGECLKNELSKYPYNIFQLLDLEGIYFARDITVHDKNALIKINATCKIGNKGTQWIIVDTDAAMIEDLHHEIFHLMQNSVHGLDKYDADNAEREAITFAKIMTNGSLNDAEKEQTTTVIETSHKIIPDFSALLQSLTRAKQKYIYCIDNLNHVSRVEFGKMPEIHIRKFSSHTV